MVHVGPLPERKTGCQIVLWRMVCVHEFKFKNTALWQTHKYDFGIIKFRNCNKCSCMPHIAGRPNVLLQKIIIKLLVAGGGGAWPASMWWSNGISVILDMALDADLNKTLNWILMDNLIIKSKNETECWFAKRKMKNSTRPLFEMPFNVNFTD